MPETATVTHDKVLGFPMGSFSGVEFDRRRIGSGNWWAAPYVNACPDSSTTTLEGQQMWPYEDQCLAESACSSLKKARFEFRLQTPFKRITLEEAFASGLRHLEEAEERRRKADELEAEFVAELLDFLDEED